ncbi:hypothetical protein CEP51_012615 [Fusarium floridanum]|uniref:Uncharacterized protein n=1 Tax=Fusarium floridanum TaxID=1325733 RepID=A0A428QQZ8_9HYPO|nr:hypothetical protein CEP51_012615 [Fusarium floridanum]
MAISPLIQRASRGETRSTLGQRKASLKTWIPCQNLSWRRTRTVDCREGYPDPASIRQDPDFPEDHRKILIEFFVSLVEMQSGNCWSTLLALGQHHALLQVSV